MKIRSKIILVVLPVLVVALCIAQEASFFSAYTGIMRIAQTFFGFKSSELEKYADGQWNLLLENNFTGRPDMVEAAKSSVFLYAKSIILSDTEIILALDDEGETAMATSPLNISPGERDRIMGILKEEKQGILNATLGGEERVFTAFYFTPFRWYILITEEEESFYGDANRIRSQTLLVLVITMAAATVMLVFFARRLTNPLGRVVKAMNDISSGGELSSRVDVEYNDETGKLAVAFNLMISELERAYAHIKRYAFEAVLAGKKEQRIRQIFQKYVPRDLIDKFFAAPESMLTGENRELAILFSDIRSFTTISENMAPDALVSSLNRYFSGQVDIIMNRNGIVDKYIGDAIMAFWGAPVKHEDDALQAVLSGLDMLEAVRVFNENQNKSGKPEFHIGIGINYGTVTVGNIGSERKMDYTVIGDMVNLASRMEGLTKTYHSEILISETLHETLIAGGGQQIQQELSFRLLDTVAVKGKTKGVKIYTVKKSLTTEEAIAWDIHNRGMESYYRRDFAAAAKRFGEVLALLGDDFNAASLLERCKTYAVTPPPPDWNGVEVMHSK
ncbi:MAG: HAMP domain-containing protein [Treponema sp.]|jgi:class 3 adenylate cyclase/HAMP domain-containing protein|nr:HAMP domain-containing protein [Treponema sp.]